MRTLALIIVVAALAAGAGLTGYISDAACGWNNARNSPEAKECALKCVNAGWDPVFVPDGDMKTYKFKEKRAVLPFVGEHVAIVGEMKNGIVTVRKIRRAAMRPAKASRT